MTSKRNATDRPWSVYILLCDNGSLYTGIARDPAERLRKHRMGTSGSKYTRSFRPERLLGCWTVAGARGSAQKVEHYIKRMGRKFKDEIIADPSLLAPRASRDLGIRLRRARKLPAIAGGTDQPPLR